MDIPCISIIVPVYNVEKYLQQCIDSILVQTFRDLELILVDDGSPDNCPALCDAAAQKDDRIRVIHQKNGGLSAARNAGLDAARGEWIGFVDSDDTIAPEMYEVLWNRVQADETQLAVCNYICVTQEGVQLPQKCTIQKDSVLDRSAAMERLCQEMNACYITAWNRLYHRSIFENVRFPVGRVHEDEYIAHEVYWKCEKVSLVEHPLYFYLQRAGSITQNETLKQKMDYAEALFQRIEFAREHDLQVLAEKSMLTILHKLAVWNDQNYAGAEETKRIRQEVRRGKKVAGQLLKMPGRYGMKAKLHLFRISTSGYHLLLHLKWARKTNAQRCVKQVGE